MYSLYRSNLSLIIFVNLPIQSLEFVLNKTMSHCFSVPDSNVHGRTGPTFEKRTTKTQYSPKAGVEFLSSQSAESIKSSNSETLSSQAPRNASVGAEVSIDSSMKNQQRNYKPSEKLGYTEASVENTSKSTGTDASVVQKTTNAPQILNTQATAPTTVSDIQKQFQHLTTTGHSQESHAGVYNQQVRGINVGAVHHVPATQEHVLHNYSQQANQVATIGLVSGGGGTNLGTSSSVHRSHSFTVGYSGDHLYQNVQEFQGNFMIKLQAHFKTGYKI